MLCLTVHVDDRVLRFPLERELVLGSAPDNTAVVPSTRVSRRHVRLEVDGSSVRIEDLGSTNGTWLNGERVHETACQAPFSLQLGKSVSVTVHDADTDDLLLSPHVSPPSPAKADSADSVTEPVPVRTSERPGDLARRALTVLARAPNRTQALVDLARESLGARRVTLLRVSAEDQPWDRDVVVQVAGTGPASDPSPMPASDELEAIRDELPEAGCSTGRLGDACSHAVAIRGSRVTILLIEQPDVDDELLEVLAEATLLLEEQPTGPPPSADTPTPTFRLGVVNGAIVDCRSPVVLALHRRMTGALSSDLPVLLTGATGTGKEIHARAIHAQSRRVDGPFQAINSSAIPESLLEATLFGAEAGAATGVRKQLGLIREANGGTFFFDEIGEMSLSLQAKLLRLLDESAVLPVGASRAVPVDVRFIAATNRDLEQEARAGHFREDLLHRLRGHEYRLPSLAQHREDIPLFVNAFLQDECRKSGRFVAGVTLKAMATLTERAWPGNVRELEAVTRRLVHEIAEGQPICQADIPPATPGLSAESGTLEERLDEVRRHAVHEALRDTDGNRSEAAKLLGVSRGGLRQLMKRLGLEGRPERET